MFWLAGICGIVGIIFFTIYYFFSSVSNEEGAGTITIGIFATSFILAIIFVLFGVSTIAGSIATAVVVLYVDDL